MKQKILIVEDEQMLSDAYRMILDQSGYEVEVSNNGKDALEKVESYKPHLILLDLRMPIMDGVGFLREYQPLINHPHVKVIVFSNYDMQDEIDEAYRLGADRYVLKAWASPRDILNLVRDALRGQSQQSNLAEHH